MRFEIRDDRLVIGGTPCRFVPARDTGGRIVPTLILLHDTAGGLDAAGSVRWLAGNPGRTSAHFVVGRDGAITQMVPADRKANHAGQSRWRGRDFCNGFSIGIEIVNPGKLLARGDGAVASFGTVYDRARYGIEMRSTRAHGAGLWMPYTEAQLAAVEQLVAALARAYPSIAEVVGHHDVSPGRKVDPNPLMDWSRVRQALAQARTGSSAPEMLKVIEREAVAERVEIEPAQQRLKQLGYYGGLVDGQLGTRTEAAVFAFQRENGLTPTGRIDPATVKRLGSDEAKPMPTGHREEASEQQLADSGSQTMLAALTDRREGSLQTVLAAVTGLLVAAKTFIQEAGVEIAIVLALAAAVWLGWRQMRRGDGLAAHRLAEHKQGIR